ncbi:MAG: YggS family pyridoxal phosphate-dependent enzyme [candidate division WOR-3 bacterium]
MSIKENIKILKERIGEICAKKGRREEITIVAVTKGISVEKIREAIASGIKIIGENRVQEAFSKYQIIGEEVAWHMVGHLQTNKVKKALQFFQMIQSVDSLHLALEIDKHAREKNKVVPVLIEVNTSGEATKFGVPPDKLFSLLEKILPLKQIKVLGLMTLGPGLAVVDPEKSRKPFRQLWELREKIREKFQLPPSQFSILSMGMSSDYEVAIEEGANMIRIGTAIFGKRD